MKGTLDRPPNRSTDQPEERTQAGGLPADANVFLEALPDMLFRLDREGRYLDFKPSKELQPYVPPDEFLGRTLHEVLPHDVADVVMPHITMAIDRNETQTCEYELPMADGTHGYEARIVPLGKNDVLAVVRDVTGRRKSHPRANNVPGINYGLTERELSVLDLVTAGMTDRQVALQLKISVETARKHVASIRKKMGATSRTDASVRAIREGLLL